VQEIRGGTRAVVEPEAERRISRIIANFSPQVMSSERIGALVAAAAAKITTTVMRGRLAELEHLARSLVQPRNQRRRKAGGVPKKFELFDRDAITAKLRVLEQLVNKKLHCRFISRYLVEISAA
jgi:hypothetical protein